MAVSDLTSPNVCILQGVVTYTGRPAGLGFGTLCYSGALANDWLSTNSVPAYPKSSICTSFAGFPLQPHLAVIALGINDCAHGVDLEDYRFALGDLCEALRAGRPDCSLLILAQSQPDGLHSDVQPFAGSAPRYTHYLAAQRVIADLYGAAFLNIHGMWNGHGASLGYQTPGNQHPSDAGHQAIADALAGLVVP
jgi:lysophospholipase L1-like esterase